MDQQKQDLLVGEIECTTGLEHLLAAIQTAAQAPVRPVAVSWLHVRICSLSCSMLVRAAECNVLGRSSP